MQYMIFTEQEHHSAERDLKQTAGVIHPFNNRKSKFQLEEEKQNKTTTTKRLPKCCPRAAQNAYLLSMSLNTEKYFKK